MGKRAAGVIVSELQPHELSLEDAAKIFKLDRSTLWRWCKRGELKQAREVMKKSRPTWVVSRLELEERQQGTSDQSILRLVAQWEKEQATGYHSGRIISPRRIKENTYGLRVFWQYLHEMPDIKNVALKDIKLSAFTPEKLRIALSNVPINYETRDDKAATKETMYFAVTSFALLLIREGLKPRQTLLEMREYKPKRVFPARKTVLQENQLVELLACNEKWTAGRSPFDRALTRTLVFILAYGGLRRSEAVSLRLGDVDFENGIIHVIDGKGHKNRSVGICPDLLSQLHAWLKFYREKTGTQSDRLLVQVSGQPITPEIINHRIQALSKVSGIPITPHGLRRTFATLMENRGMPWSLMQISLGHASIKTTQRYVMSDERQAIAWLKGFGKEAPEDNQTAIMAALKSLMDQP
jgi:integrase